MFCSRMLVYCVPSRDSVSRYAIYTDRGITCVKGLRRIGARDMSVGAAIRSLRKARGYTQEGLALAMDWPASRQKDISEYETGVKVPETDTLSRIAGALGVTLADLVADTPLSTEFVRGYSAGLAAARDAVKALTPPEPSTEDAQAQEDAATSPRRGRSRRL